MMSVSASAVVMELTLWLSGFRKEEKTPEKMPHSLEYDARGLVLAVAF